MPEHVLEYDVGDEALTILADVTQLKQIFWNLARNAIQAMPYGGTLTMSADRIPNNRVRITFGDTGVGMTPDQVERLFEPFSESTTGGTGLGLSIVYQIVKDHNGAINVRSRKSEGTVITVDLPRENRRASADRPAPVDDKDGSRLKEFLNIGDGHA